MRFVVLIELDMQPHRILASADETHPEVGCGFQWEGMACCVVITLYRIPLWEGTVVRPLIRIPDTISAIWHKSTPS